MVRAIGESFFLLRWEDQIDSYCKCGHLNEQPQKVTEATEA